MADPQFISCEQRPIPDKEGRDLQLWLAKPEGNTLVRIVGSKAKDEISKSTNAALQAVGPSPLKINVADEHLRNARKYLDFLEILQAIKDQTEPFTVSKWT